MIFRSSRSANNLKAMKMTLIPQASAAALLLILTLCLQCAGVAALVEWLRGVTATGGQGFGPVRSAVLVVKSTIAIIILHGLVILLWASFYRLQCFPSWELAFYFSSSSYATVGYGDVTLPSRWRLLGPLESMAGGADVWGIRLSSVRDDHTADGPRPTPVPRQNNDQL